MIMRKQKAKVCEAGEMRKQALSGALKHASNVNHALLQVRSQLSDPGWRGRRAEVASDNLILVVVGADILASTICKSVGQESRSAVADGTSAATHHIADVVGQFLDSIRGVVSDKLAKGIVCKDLIVDNDIVGRASGALQGRLCLKEEVPVDGASDASIDHGSIGAVRSPIHIRLFSWEEARIVTLSTNQDGDVRLTILVKRLAGLSDAFQLLSQNHVVLALADTITVNQNVLWQFFSIVILPTVETLPQHFVQV